LLLLLLLLPLRMVVVVVAVAALLGGSCLFGRIGSRRLVGSFLSAVLDPMDVEAVLIAIDSGKNIHPGLRVVWVGMER
jgi:hypothetical protein